MNCMVNIRADDRLTPTESRAAFALDLARQPDGYLCPDSEIVKELAFAGLVTIKPVCDGFVIIKAVHVAVPRSKGWFNSRWSRAAERGAVLA